MHSNLLAAVAFTFASGLLAGCVGADSGDNASQEGAAISASTISSIALANVGHSACGSNTKGGKGYETSCTGNGGEPEYWCADFARWVWAQAGVSDTSQLDAAAGSFYVYGQNHGTLSHTPHVGDAVVFDYQGNGRADHVAIVTQVNSNGTIETVSGDWNGESGSEAHFSSTSHVVHNAPAYAAAVGDHPGIMGMTISGFISPLGVSHASGGGSTSSAAPDACSEAEGYCTETLQCLNGHWIIRQDDPNACSGGYHDVAISCKEGNGYCTETLQCKDGAWVNRLDDANACTSGSW